MRRQRSRRAFTLIELMVVVAITGVLSAVAIPTFSGFVKRSKTAESASNLDSMFKTAASYYASERSSQGQTSTTSGHCNVADGGPAPRDPKKGKQPLPDDESFRALGFSIADHVYFSYGLWAKGAISRCDNSPNIPDLYTFYAIGDLDEDGTRSLFELSAGADASNLLYHSRSMFVLNETE